MQIDKKRVALSAIIITLISLIIMDLSSIDAYATTLNIVESKEGLITAFNNFVLEYKNLLGGIVGLALLTNIGLFIYHFCQLGATSSNPQKRAQVIHNLMIVGITTALFGAVPIIYIILYRTVTS